MTSQALNRPVDVLGKLATMALHHGDAWVEVHDAVAELIDAAAYALASRDYADALTDTAVCNLRSALAAIGSKP